MKKHLIALATTFALAVASSFGHGGVELGPNGGRVLEFSNNESVHGEVTVKDGKFHIAVLDKDLKPVALAEQSLTATGGDRNKPEKLAVEKDGNHFVVPQLKGDDYWVIFQFKQTPKDKAVTARLHFDATICSECKKQEWLCDCGKKDEKKK